MGDSGVLVRPFTGDIDSTRSHILDKPWRPEELEEIRKTPGLLMIDEDFDTFDPRKHRWLFIHLPAQGAGFRPNEEFVGEKLARLAEAVSDADTDVFDSVRAVIYDVGLADFAKVFEAKPGVFGFSIDLVMCTEVLYRLWLKLTKGKRVLPTIVDQSGWTKCPKCGKQFQPKNREVFDGKRHLTCGTYLRLTVGA